MNTNIKKLFALSAPVAIVGLIAWNMFQRRVKAKNPHAGSEFRAEEFTQ